MMAIPDLGEISYHLPFYMSFVEKIKKVLQQLKKKGEAMNISRLDFWYFMLKPT